MELMGRYPEIRATDSEWTNEIPEELVARLATATDSELQSAATQWAETDEMAAWNASDAMEVLIDVQRVAQRAMQKQQPMFLYACL